MAGSEEGGPFRFLPAVIRYPADHPFFEDGDIHRHMYLQGLLENVTKDPERPRTSEFSCQIGGCSQIFNTLESYEHHYNMLHRNVCCSCKRAFPSTHLLDVHILEWHDSLFQIMAEKQNMYQCLVESCPEKFKSSKDRKDHLITVHQYPSDFRFDKSLKAQRKEKMRPSSKESNVPMDMTVKDSEQSHVEAMDIGPDESIMETECTVDSPGKRLYRSRPLKPLPRIVPQPYFLWKPWEVYLAPTLKQLKMEHLQRASEVKIEKATKKEAALYDHLLHLRDRHEQF